MTQISPQIALQARAIAHDVVDFLAVGRAPGRLNVTREHRLLDVLQGGISSEELALAFQASLGEEPPEEHFHPEQTILETAGVLARAGFESQLQDWADLD